MDKKPSSYWFSFLEWKAKKELIPGTRAKSLWRSIIVKLAVVNWLSKLLQTKAQES